MQAKICANDWGKLGSLIMFYANTSDRQFSIQIKFDEINDQYEPTPNDTVTKMEKVQNNILG